MVVTEGKVNKMLRCFLTELFVHRNTSAGDVKMLLI